MSDADTAIKSERDFEKMFRLPPEFEADYRGHCLKPLGQIDTPETLVAHERRDFSTALLIFRVSSHEDIADEIDQEQLAQLKRGSFAGVECHQCGKYVRFECDENLRFTATSECTEAGGVQPYDMLLDVPSGRIVFANDMRSLVRNREPGMSISSRLGTKKVSQSYADVGMIHIMVGNSCPGVYRTADGGLTVANVGAYETEEEAEKDGYKRDNPPDDKLHSLGLTEYLDSICTDLWWFSAMDHDHYLKRCQIEGESPELGQCDFIVDVEPGTYRVRDNLKCICDDQTVIYSTFARQEERVPFVELPELSEREQFFDWLHHDGYQNGYDFARLDHALYVLGNGFDWVGGSLSEQSRKEDARYQEELSPAVGHPFTADIPIFENFPCQRLYPLSLRYPGEIGAAPYEISLYWLGAGMMMTRSYLAGSDNAFRLWSPEQRNDVEANAKQVVEQRDILSRVLDMLCEIAEKRGLLEELKSTIFPDLLASVKTKAYSEHDLLY